MLHALHMAQQLPVDSRGFLCGVAAIIVLVANSAQGQEADLSVARDGDYVVVSARADIPVERSLAWEVLTDYDRYPRFIPDLRISRVLSRSEGLAVVEQEGRFTFLFFSEPVEVRLAVHEEPRHLVESHALAGNLKDLKSRYELLDEPSGTRLVYSGRFVPQALPPFIGLLVVRSALRKQFFALVAEIARRGADRGLAGKPAG